MAASASSAIALDGGRAADASTGSRLHPGEPNEGSRGQGPTPVRSEFLASGYAGLIGTLNAREFRFRPGPACSAIRVSSNGRLNPAHNAN